MNHRPLTRRNKDGELYKRDKKVEEQIAILTDLPIAEVVARSRKMDASDPEYVQAETLIYWIREYHRLGQSVEASDLAEILSERCESMLQSKLYRLGNDQKQQAAQDVLSDMMQVIANVDSDKADYLEVRFWDGLEAHITNTFIKYTKAANRAIPLSAIANEDALYDDEATVTRGWPRASSTKMTMEERVLVQDALSSIDEPYRTAFMMYHFHDWQIESKDPGKQSISRYFEKDPRTIRNWLKHAEKILIEWRKEER